MHFPDKKSDARYLVFFMKDNIKMREIYVKKKQAKKSANGVRKY